MDVSVDLWKVFVAGSGLIILYIVGIFIGKNLYLGVPISWKKLTICKEFTIAQITQDKRYIMVGNLFFFLPVPIDAEVEDFVTVYPDETLRKRIIEISRGHYRSFVSRHE